MKNAGYLLIALGFLAAAWVSVQHSLEMNWLLYLATVAIGVVGVVLARIGARSEARTGQRLSGDIRSLEESIERIVTNITELDARKQEMNPYDVHGRIDELFVEDLATFVDARESIAHVHSLQAYADVMNAFTAGERYLNRTWSASVDGYIDEVQQYVGRAREQFVAARDKLRALQAKKPEPQPGM